MSKPACRCVGAGRAAIEAWWDKQMDVDNRPRLQRLCAACGLLAEALEVGRVTTTRAGRKLKIVSLSESHRKLLATLLTGERNLNGIHRPATAEGLLKELLLRIRRTLSHGAQGNAKRSVRKRKTTKGAA